MLSVRTLTFLPMTSLQLRRLEAEVRHNTRRGLSPKQQLEILDRRPGEAKRERARLQSLLSAEKPVQTSAKPVNVKGRKAK